MHTDRLTDIVANSVDFVADTVDCRQCVRDQSAWSTFSTFNKVDRVKFNFVACVYRA